MAEKATTAQAVRADSDSVDWTALVPKNVGYENAMGAEQVKVVWAKMMQLAGLRAPNETKQRAFKLAIYVYGVLNGTSREGEYKALIELNDGFKFSSSVIPLATGKVEIRKFYRGNMVDSYLALKGSKAIEGYDEFVAKAAQFGVAADVAFALADWMTNCALFTPAETRAHETSFNSALSRSRRARSGRSLEEVESDRHVESLEAQGPIVTSVTGGVKW